VTHDGKATAEFKASCNHPDYKVKTVEGQVKGRRKSKTVAGGVSERHVFFCLWGKVEIQCHAETNFKGVAGNVGGTANGRT